MPKGLIDSIMATGPTEEASALAILYDTKNYQRLKMVSEIPASLESTLTLLGVIQRRYKSEVLKLYDEEFLSRQKSRDRQGIGELIEVLLGMRSNRASPERDE
jgi:hypothetical protein